MKNKLLKLVQYYPFFFSKIFSNKKIIFPFYHAVNDITETHHLNLYKVKKIADFKKDIELLLKHYKPSSFEQIKKHLKTDSSPNKNQFVFSFDDGLREVYEIIAPILKQKGIPAVFFINSDFVGNKKLFFRSKYAIISNKISNNKNAEKLKEYLKNEKLFDKDLPHTLGSKKQNIENILNKSAEFLGISFSQYLKEKKPYMTTEEIKELQKQGFEIGAHSKSHLLYEHLTIEEKLTQTIDSLNFVQNKFNPKNKLFAFPFTDNAVEKGFFIKLYQTKLVDFTFGTAGIKKDEIKNNIQRIPMDRFENAKQALNYNYLAYFLRTIIGKNTILR